MKKIFVILPLICLIFQSVAMDRSHQMAMRKARGRAVPVCYDKAPDRLMLTGDPRFEPSAEFTGGFSVTDDVGTKVLAGTMAAMLIFAQAAAFAPAHGPQFVPRKDWDGVLPRGFDRDDVATLSKSRTIEPLGRVANVTEPIADRRGSCCTPPSYAECYHECVKVGCLRCGIEKSHCHLTCASCPSLQQSIAKLNDRIYSIADTSGDLRKMYAERQTAAEAVAGLIRCGAPLEERGDHGLTALMMAAGGGYALLAECLLKSGANASAVTSDNLTAFDLAVMSSIPPRSNIFAMVPWAATKEFCQPGRFEIMKLLMQYSHAEKSEIKKRIVELVELIHKSDSVRDKKEIYNFFFENLFGETSEPDPVTDSLKCRTELSDCSSVEAPCCSLLQYTRELLSDLHGRMYAMAESGAPMFGETDAAVKNFADLVRRGALLEEDQGGDGITPLMATARNGLVPLFEILIKAGANTTAADHNGFTAFDYAVLLSISARSNPDDFLQWGQPGRFKILQLLIQHEHLKKSIVKKRIAELVELAWQGKSERDRKELCGQFVDVLYTATR